MDLFVEIRSTVGQEAQIVQAVFPNPPFVMQVFLQRVFAQSVSALPVYYYQKANSTYADTRIYGAASQ
jgi:hypothetical protein